MPWSADQVIPAIKNKSLELRQLFAKVANAALAKGQSEEEAVFAGLSAVKLAEKKKTEKAVVEKPKLPSHVQAILDLKKQAPIQQVNTDSGKISQAFLGKNALESDPDRSLVSAVWDKNGRLILTFDDGKQIITDPVPVSEHIEQFVTVSSETANELPESYDHVQFNLLSESLGAVGRLVWNEVDGTLDLGLAGGNVTLQVGQEQVVHIYNNTANAFTDLQVVRVTGSQGQRLTASLAQANSELTSSATFAVVTEPIAKNQEGFATTSGMVRNVNTIAFPEGAALYLSPSTPGGLTHIKPQAPNHMVLVGWCVRSHHINGSVYVHVQNGYELEELHNVSINSPQHGQVLKYDSTAGIWRNQEDQSSADAPETNAVFTYNSQDEITRIDYSSGNYKLFVYNTDGDLSQLDYVKGSLIYRKVFNYTSGVLTNIVDSVLSN